MAISHTVEQFKQDVNWGSPINSFAFDAFTPANSSLLVVLLGFTDNGDVDGAEQVSISDTQTLTWTKQDYADVGGGYNGRSVIWTAPVSTGASTTVTVSFDEGIGAYTGTIIEVTGQHASPIGATEATAGETADGAKTITLSASPASDSYVFAQAYIDGDSDGTYACTHGSGWTEENEGGGTALMQGGQVQYRTGSTSDSVAWADLQTGTMTVYSSGLCAIEIKAAAAAGISIPVVMAHRRSQGAS